MIHFWLCRVQVLKLCTFWFMHQECQAYEQLPDWKKKFPINLTGYDSFLLSKEQRHEKYKEHMATQALNLKTLDQIEVAISHNKEQIEAVQRTHELQLVDGRDTTSFVPVEYDIVDVQNVSVCESRNVVASVSELQSISFDELRTAVQSINCEEQCVKFAEMSEQTDFEMGNSVQSVNLNEQQASVLPVTSDPTYMELELSDVLVQYSAEESFAINTSDHMYTTATESVSDHVYATATESISDHVYATATESVSDYVYATATESVSDYVYATATESVSDHLYTTAPNWSENQKPSSCKVRNHDHVIITVKKRRLSKRKTMAYSHISKAMKCSCKCIVTKVHNITIRTKWWQLTKKPALATLSHAIVPNTSCLDIVFKRKTKKSTRQKFFP